MIFRVILFTFLYFGLASAADPQQFFVLNGHELPRDLSVENASVDKGTYIVPNEWNPGAQYSALSSAHGLLLSVGTFRTLIIYAWSANITHLLAVDFDRAVVEFNRGHFSAIHAIAEQYPDDVFLQRFHYVCMLHGRQFKGELLAAERATANIVLLVRSLIKNNDARLTRSYGYQGEVVTQFGIELKMVQFQNEIWVGNNMSQSLFQYRIPPEDSRGYYWDNDDQWRKIVVAINMQKIALAALDLNSDHDALTLKSFFESAKINFGAIDRSNITQISDALPVAPLVLFSQSENCEFRNFFKLIIS